MKKAFRFIGVVLFNIALTAILMELSLRVSQGFFYEGPDWIQPDEILGTTGRANFTQTIGIGKYRLTVTHNALGLRGPDRPKLRIMLIGDSFTHGEGVSDGGTISQQMQQMLVAQGIDAEVLNLGLGGYSTAQAYYRLRSLIHLRPDLIIYTFCDNDPADNAEFVIGKKHPPKPEQHRAWWRVMLRRYSLTFMTAVLKRAFISHYPSDHPTHLFTANQQPKIPEFPELETELTHKFVDSMAILAKEYQAQFMIGFINVGLTKENAVILSPIAEHYAAMFQEMGIQLIPAPQTLANYSNNLSVLRGEVPYEGHFNAVGYRLWADVYTNAALKWWNSRKAKLETDITANLQK